MMPPMITILDAEFSDDIIRFQDSMPLCVTYKYEIDLKSDTITFERSAKDKRSTPIHNFGEPCGDVEKVVRAHFVGSSELKSESSSNLSNHFVPILSAIAFIARVIN